MWLKIGGGKKEGNRNLSHTVVLLIQKEKSKIASDVRKF